MHFLRFFFRKHPIATVLLLLCLGGATVFAVRFTREAIYFSDPAHQRQDLEGWMSPRYVGKSWDLPPGEIVRIMELEPDHRQRTLDDVTAHLGISMEALQQRVEAAKAQQMRHHPGPDNKPNPREATPAPQIETEGA